MPYFTTRQTNIFDSFILSEKEREKMDKYLLFLEESGVGKIIDDELDRDYPKGGRPPYNPYNLFSAIIFAFSKHSGSLRKIEESIMFDTHFMYLMNYEKPSYVSISKFLNNLVVKKQHAIYFCLVSAFIKLTNISIDDTFLDGTKFEANANKYKFVWKPTTFHKKLISNIREIFSKYGIITNDYFSSFDMTNYIGKLNGLPESRQLKKDYKKLSKYLIKKLEYEEKEEICGNRNSYYKTDQDATAMCLKEDYYSGLGSNMHAAYNCQIIVSKGIILEYYLSQDRADSGPFIPIIEQFYTDFGFCPKRICADSGYGSISNYKFLENNNIENYVKYTMWENEKKGKSINLFNFDGDGNLYCLNNKKATALTSYSGRHPKHGKYLYLIDDCNYCRYKSACREPTKDKSKKERVFDVSYDYYRLKEMAKRNLLTRKGIEMRINRSSQVEGAFGAIKQNMDYDRLRRRGLKNASLEICLICIGYLIRKLFSFFDGKLKCDYWIAPDNLLDDSMPIIDTKNFKFKKRKKGLNETLREKRR